MKYEQHNPLPLPKSGPYQSIRSTMDSVFDWQYELRRQNLMALYEKGKAMSWNATDLDWSIDVDLEKHDSRRASRGRLWASMLQRQVLKPPRTALARRRAAEDEPAT